MLPASKVGILQGDLDNAALYKVGDGDLEAFGLATGRWYNVLQVDPAIYWLAQKHGLVPQSTDGYFTAIAAMLGLDPVQKASPEYPEFYKLLQGLINVINRGVVQAQMDYDIAHRGYPGVPHVVWAPYLDDAVTAEFTGVPWVAPNAVVAGSGGAGSYNLAPQAPPAPDAGYPVGIQFLALPGSVQASFPPATWYIVAFRRATVYDKILPEGGNTRFSDWIATPSRWNVRRSPLTDGQDTAAALWGTRPVGSDPTPSWAAGITTVPLANTLPEGVLSDEAAFFGWLKGMLPNIMLPSEWQQSIEPIGAPGLSPSLQGTSWVDIAVPPGDYPAPTLSGAIRPVTSVPTGGGDILTVQTTQSTQRLVSTGATGDNALTGPSTGAQITAPQKAANFLFDWRVWAVIAVVILIVMAMAKRRR